VYTTTAITTEANSEWVQLRCGNRFSKYRLIGVSNRPAGDLLISTSGNNPAIDPTVNTTGSAVPKTNPVIRPLIAKWVRVIMVLEIDNYYKILVNHSYSE
jgi:hypothetical protein